MRFLVEQTAMKKFFAVVFICLPAFGQATYSGPGLLSGSGTHSGQPCGPGNGYACFVQTTGVVNLTVPIPSWGPNTCDSTSLDTLSTCGNLTGASPTTVQTPSDFGNAMARCTDVNTTGVASDVLTTQDDPYPAIWNINDTAFLAKKASSAEYILKFNPATLQCTMTSVSFPIRAIWSHTDPYHLFSLGGSSGVVVSDNTVASDFSSITSTTTKYDFNNSSCLTNPVNGYSAGGPTGFNATSYSVFLSSLDDTFFSEGFSNTGGQGTGVYVVAWTVGQSGCDLYNTATGTVTHNGTLVGSVPDQWGGAAYGGIPDLFYHHSVFTPLSDNYVIVSATASNYIQGNQTAGNDLLVWNVGTTSVKQCGIAAVNWTASHTYTQLGSRISPTSGNAGGYIYQIVTAGNEGTSGGSAPTWNQTPGSDTVDATVTWRNIGLGAAQKYACDGHTWNGYSGFGAQKNSVFHSYADPSTPLSVHLIPSPAADDHYGATNDNADDTAWMFAITGVVSKPVNLLGTLPGFGYYEGFFISPVNKAPGVPNDTGVGGTLGQTRRAFHTYNTGYDPTFDVQNGVAMLSQTGKFALLTTDGMGQFGNLSGQAKCNIGGVDWNPNNSTDYAVGEKVFPNPQYGGNNGHYVYQIQSCSGTCTTGATKPTWVQSSTVADVGTFTNGTITYAAAPDAYISTNTAVQNCRADLLVVKLTR
jgi:hypothetical protein